MDKKIDNAKSYDLISDNWQKFRNSTAINKCVVDFAKLIAPNGHVLEIGCGTGYPVAHYLSLHNFTVTGIDVSREMIAKAKALKLPNAVFLNREVLDFSSDIRYDAVIAFDSLWHIAKSEQAEVYRKISCLMKDGAYFLFTHGKRNDERVGTMFNQPFYYGALDIYELNTIFSETGLKIISLTEDYKEQTMGERDLLVIAQKQRLF